MTKYPSTKEARSQNDEKHRPGHTSQYSPNQSRLQSLELMGAWTWSIAFSEFVIRISFGLGYFVIRH